MGPFLVAGVVLGGIYAISSTGLVFTYASAGIFNLAFAAQAYFIARLFYFLNSQHGYPSWLAGILAIAVAGPILGALLWAIVFRHLQQSSTLIKIVATIGLTVSLPPISSLIFGNLEIVTAPGLAPEPVKTFFIFNTAITLDQIIVVSTVVLLGIIGSIVFRLTDIGLAVRGLVDSEAMSKISGTNSSAISISVWAISSFLAGLAGVLIAPQIGLAVDTFTVLLSAAFAAVVIANFSSIPIAIASSMFLGVITGIFQYLLPPTSSLTTPLLFCVPFGFMAVYIVGDAIIHRGAARDVRTGGPLDSAIRVNAATSSSSRPRTGTHKTIVASPEAKVNWRRIHPNAAAFALLFAVPFILNGFWLGLFASGAAYAISFLAITLVTGDGGMIWLCQITFTGVGAITYGQLAERHVPIFVALLACAAVTSLMGILVGVLTVWLGDLRTTLVTLSVGLLVEQLLFMWAPFYNDGSGVLVNRPTFITGDRQYALLVLAFFGALALMIWRLRRSTTGLALNAARSSERGSRSIGLGVVSLKIMVGAFGAAAAGIGGAFLALYSLTALPPSYATLNGLIWLAIVVTLGARSSGAALAAGMSFTIIPGLFLQYLSPTISELPAAMFGVGAILVARNPDGILAMHRRQLASLSSRWRARFQPDPLDKVKAVGLFRDAESDVPVSKIEFLEVASPYQRAEVENREPQVTSMRGLDTSAPPLEGLSGLRAEEISVRFGGVLALSNVSIEVPRSKITAIVGPNGAGKSTLFGVLSGFQACEAGRVWLDGTEVSKNSARDRARKGLARTFQQPELFWTMTPREHLLLGYRSARDPGRVWRDWLSIRRAHYAEEEDCVRRILGLLGLESVADRDVAELPLGMGRLVEVGRAMAAFPGVLLLDEPCAGLDPRETNEVARVLQRLVVDEGTGILLVEHDLEIVMRIANEVVVLDHGVVIARGSPEEVRNDPAVQRAYLGADLALGEQNE